MARSKRKAPIKSAAEEFRKIASPSISLFPSGAVAPGYRERLIAPRSRKHRRGENDVYPSWDLPAGAALFWLEASANPFLTAVYAARPISSPR